ncbi:hypothetical protein [Vibrio sp. B1Z05]|uniref:hypothetical protein n=1 Tax=Vibrio sp. B1Z05 TaxID=2654980 RepID=UPI00128D74ED|nr:hypothetical protein [Vibrio sp. B1Z05]MPW35966.1 hypothetical protein [Vibrio sp. B1Z05]
MELRCFSKAAVIIGTSFAPLYSSATSFELPIWKSEAEERGYVLPKAFGISVGYMRVEQGISVDSISFDGLKTPEITIPPIIPGRPPTVIPEQPIPAELIGIETSPGFQRSDVFTVRADMWLFPFLNFYAIAGKISGYSETNISVDIGGIDFEPVQDERFLLDLDGNMYGGGLVLAGGYKEWFTIIDASYTKTNLTVIEGGIDSIVITPRLGYDFTNHGVPIRVWGGAQYQNIQQTLKGKISDLELPSALEGLLDFVNGDDEGRFIVEQSLANEWNAVVGFNYVINPTFNIIGEFGFGDRQSALISLDTRF